MNVANLESNRNIFFERSWEISVQTCKNSVLSREIEASCGHIQKYLNMLCARSKLHNIASYQLNVYKNGLFFTLNQLYLYFLSMYLLLTRPNTCKCRITGLSQHIKEELCGNLTFPLCILR